jgi:hypothetical protein
MRGLPGGLTRRDFLAATTALALTACRPLAFPTGDTVSTLPPLSGLDGVRRPLPLKPGTRAVVLMTLSVDCPISNQLLPDYRELARRHAAEGVSFHELYPNVDETDAAVAEHRIAYGTGPIAWRDPEGGLTRRFGLTVTPQVLAVTPNGRLIYRGRLHDQFEGLGVRRPAPRRMEFAEVLARFLAEGHPRAVETKAIGCRIRTSPRPAAR